MTLDNLVYRKRLRIIEVLNDDAPSAQGRLVWLALGW